MAETIRQRRAFVRSLSVLAIVVTLAIGGELAFQAGWYPFRDKNTAADSGLVVPESRLDFGEVWDNTAFQWVLSIENPQSRDIEINNLAASCTCAAIEPRSLIIPAGETREVRLTLDLSARRSKVPESEWRDFEVIVRPFIRDGDATVRKSGWRLRGRVHTAIRFQEPVVDLGRHSEASQPLPPRSIVVDSYVPVRTLVTKCSSPGIATEVAASRESTRQFQLTFRPSVLAVGPINADVVVLAELANGTRLPGKTLRITGGILLDVVPTPPEVVFGAKDVGDTADDTIALHSLTGQTFSVRDIKVDDPNLTVKPVPSANQVESVFQFVQRITQPGQHTAKAVFLVQRKGFPDARVEVPVVYLGTEPSAKIQAQAGGT